MTLEVNKIYCGDNVELCRQLPSEYVDLTITSPPYDNLRTYNGFTWDFEALAHELYRITKLGGVVVWVVNDSTIKGSETGTSFRQALYFKGIGFNIHDTMIYLKKNIQFPESNRYYSGFEYMFVFSKGKPKTVNLIKDRKNISAGKKVSGTERKADGILSRRPCEGNICAEYGVRYNYWPFNNVERPGHPAPFPTKMCVDHIYSWSKKEEIVFDPFMGSGTTAIAAIKTGRRYIGFELSQEYCDLAQKRIEKALGEQK